MPSMTPMMSTIFCDDSLIERHGVDDLADHLAALDGHVGGAGRELVGLAGVVGVLLDGGGQLFHRGGGFFERRGLLFGALRQVGVAGGDLLRGARHRFGAVSNAAYDVCKARVHRLHRVQEPTDLVVRIGLDVDRQVACGDRIRHAHGTREGPHDAAN